MVRPAGAIKWCWYIRTMNATRPPVPPRRILETLRSGREVVPDKLEGSPERILDTALVEISEGGLRRFTVDGLSKRVGLSRVTIYRHFPGKDGILEAVLLRELRRFMLQVGEVVARYDTLDRRVIEGSVFALTWLRQHKLLNRLLRNEPELILPLLTTQGAPVIEAARDFITSFSRPRDSTESLHLDSLQWQVLGEMLARLILSLVLTPESTVELQTEEQIRAFGEKYVGAVVHTFTGTH